MNINLFTQRFTSFQNYKRSDNTHNYSHSNPIRNNNLAPLKADTVSFGAAKFALKIRTVEDALEDQFTLEGPRLLRLGTVYHAVLKIIAGDSNGAFRISDNIEHLIKDPKTRVKKIIRSRSFKVPDILRLTGYSDPYEFDNFLYVLDKMKDAGFVPDKVPMRMDKLMKRGYIPTEEENIIMTYLAEPNVKNLNKKIIPFFKDKGYYADEIRKLIDDLLKLDHIPAKDEFYEMFEKINKDVPDIDIRLKESMVTQEQIKKLPEELRFCIGKPQDSSYEDIQIRFVRNYVKEKENQVPHELIILFGENYHNAKSRESHFVYSHLRKFKELGAKRFFENEKYDKETSKAKNYIELIEEMFHGKISKKEFINGKNKDYMGEKKETKIFFTEDDELLLKGYIEGLIKEIGRPYNKAISKTAKAKRKPLRSALKADREKIRNDIYENLKATIEAYNSGKAYEYTDPKPKAKRTRTKKQ